MSSLPLGSVARQWRPVLSCEPEPNTVPSFWATWKSIVQGRSASVSLAVGLVELRRSVQSKSRQQSASRARCSRACTAACAPCRPGSRPFGAVDQLQQVDHLSSTVHAAPADLAFGGELLAVVVGDRRLAEGLGDALLVAFGIVLRASRRRRRPSRSAPRRRAARPAPAVSWRSGSLADLGQELFPPILGAPIAEPPPVGGQTGATTRADHQVPRLHLVGQRLQVVVAMSMSTCGANRNRSTPSNFTPSTSAARSGRASCPGRSAARALPLADHPGPGRVVKWGNCLRACSP
jgi:hypothetical protein